MMFTNDGMPPDLMATFDSLEYEEDGRLIIQSIQWFGEDVHFNFQLCFDNNKQRQNWQLQIKNCRNTNVNMNPTEDYFEFYQDHFLLWEFNDNNSELYFKRQARDVTALLVDIYSLHHGFLEGLVSTEKYVNGRSLSAICESGYGLFAKGPKKILDLYFECLTRAGMEPYFFGDFTPKRWEEGKWMEEARDYKVALLGETYFVGEEFIFKRIDEL